MDAPSPMISHASEPMLTIDGSFGEGGGQVLRSSLSLALVTRRSFTMTNIRRSRVKPGLMPQKILKFCKATGQKAPITTGEYVRRPSLRPSGRRAPS